MITVVAIVCSLSLGCVEEIVTDSDVSPEVTMTSCMMGESQIVKWMQESKYKDWKLESWKCVPGRYQIRNRA
ncbi:hypothetical protein [Bradyrhizobium erythrophlei]|uniref:Uncharacterized protein n=1 Tax=Bradyrhizobium erythrophlei TaxID=1437360 RepID=A0A1M5T9S8_9BRAD|nr:hypothetical protein [Bradyrhizobium erythrophlei]SHH47517.1 hypothetical protein SAMN05444169_7637 [Bradyrhizobium erythrophlei]